MLSVEARSYGPSTSKSVHPYPSSVSSQQSAGFFGSVSSRSSAITRSSADNTHHCSAKRNRPRHSLSILSSLPKDISALIRSHSTNSRRQHTQQHHQQDSHASTSDMVKDDDRPSRKLKSENKLYRFIARSLTRSRSRSRSHSRNGRDTPPPIDLNEPIPDLPPTQNGRLRIDTMGQSSPSKPTTRIPSRPLSSTTTATNATITPSTPKPKKRPPPAIPIPVTSKYAEPPPRPTTPKPSATRKKLHTLFGIPLSSPKKSSFNSSRHSSRRPSLEPLPSPPAYEDEEGEELDDDPTPRALRPYSARPYDRPESPTPELHVKLNHDTGNSTTTNSSGSSRLQRFLTRSKTPPASIDAVSGPIRRPSDSSHRRQNSASSPTRSKSDDLPPIPSPQRMMSPSRIPTVPETASRSKRPGTAPQTALASSVGHSSRKSSAESGASAGTADHVGALNGYSRIKTQGPGRSQRTTKHGSFDFERPGWSASVMQRAGSGGTTGTGTSAGTSLSGWGRGHDGPGTMRDSAMGPGLAGVGTLQREASMKRAKEREEMMDRMRDEERRRRKADAQAAKEKLMDRDLGLLHERPRTSPRTLSPDETRAPSSTTAKSSSWGKRGGALIGGKGKATPIGLSHGLFDFEPPVPSATRSTGSVEARHGQALTISWAGETSKEKSRSKGEASNGKDKDKDKRKSREKERRSQTSHRGDRAPVPVPSASVGHKSGTRGRSLDLGLGLAWAPSSMRESAMIPSSRLLGRSLSGASSMSGRSIRTTGGRSVSNSTNEHSTIEEEKSLLGSHVAEVFKNALDDAGYKAFRRYVHLFDMHDIPFDGPTGIVAHVERLLTTAPALSEEGKRQLLDNFVRIVLQHA